jgi:hypothetical protein
VSHTCPAAAATDHPPARLLRRAIGSAARGRSCWTKAISNTRPIGQPSQQPVLLAHPARVGQDQRMNSSNSSPGTTNRGPICRALGSTAYSPMAATTPTVAATVARPDAPASSSVHPCKVTWHKSGKPVAKLVVSGPH